MKFVILLMLFVFLVSIVIMRYIEKILHGNQYLNVIRIFALAIMINIMIFIFLVNTFDKIKFKQGIRGPQGNRGDQGYQGQYDKCAVCGPQPQTVGYIKTEKMKRELVIPKKPNIVGEKYTEREQYILKPEEKPIEKIDTTPIIKKCDIYATYNPEYEFHRYSSIYDNNRMGTVHARGKLYSPQAWSAGRNSQGQWFEIRSDQKLTVMGVIVQPRGGRYSYQKVTSFKVKYSLDRSEYLDDKHMSDVDDGKIFNNSNNKYNFKVLFDNPVECYSIRIYPTKWKYHISMRAALLVCGKWDKCATEGNSIKEIGSYRDTRWRALRYGPHRYGYDVKKCSAACKNYKYFALQNNQTFKFLKGWCSCDNDLNHATKYGKRSCGKRGGGWCNYIYENVNTCKCEGDVRYGKGNNWIVKNNISGGVACNNSEFGNPIYGTKKECQCIITDN